MPVQYSYNSTPPMAVRPVLSLSACTVQLYLYSPYGPYGVYRASVTVQYSYTSTPLWAVQPVQSLSACTTVHFTFTFLIPLEVFTGSEFSMWFRLTG